MAEKLDPRQVVTFEELLRAMMFETEATRRILVRKGLHVALTVLLPLAAGTVEAAEKVTIGAVEDVVVLPWNVTLPARIDTGAATSSLNARELMVRDNEVIFKLPDEYGGLELRLPIVEWRYIRSSEGVSLQPDRKYYWSVRMRRGEEVSEWSRFDYRRIGGYPFPIKSNLEYPFFFFRTPVTSQGDSTTVQVVRVVDGDTIQVCCVFGDRVTVRYIGLDTPETHHPMKGVEPYGKEASEANRKLVDGKTVRLEFDVQQLDRYGRTLAYVYLEDGTFVNAWLVENGYAQVMTIPPNVKHQDLFLKLQREAREVGRGLWK